MICFDTNILVYAADRQAGPRHTQSGELLRNGSVLDTGLTEQSLIEFLNVATRKAQTPLPVAIRFVQAWLAIFRLLIPTETVVTDTVQLLGSHKLSTWDARLLAVCAANGCSILFSEDLHDGALYGGVRVVNPFNPENAGRTEKLLRA